MKLSIIVCIFGALLFLSSVRAGIFSEFNTIDAYDFTSLSIMPNERQRVYISREWAHKRVGRVPRWSIAGLAVLYAIIERARGNIHYKIGLPGTWSDAVGAIPISGTGHEGPFRQPPSKQKVISEIINQNPVILISRRKKTAGNNYYLLVIGFEGNGTLLVIDPYKRGYGFVSTGSWRYRSRSGIDSFKIDKMQLVDMRRSKELPVPD